MIGEIVKKMNMINNKLGCLDYRSVQQWNEPRNNNFKI